MEQMIVENVRCFYGRHQAPLRSITLLVGENSSGKSTFLALVRVAWDIYRQRSVEFNEEPFFLGAYDQIASLDAKNNTPAKSFTIGYRNTLELVVDRKTRRTSAQEILVTSSFMDLDAQPSLTKWAMHAGEYSVELRIGRGKTRQRSCIINTPSSTLRVNAPAFFFGGQRLEEPYPSLRNLVYLLRDDKNFFTVTKGKSPTKSEIDYLAAIMQPSQRRYGSRPQAFAPIRSQPQRTYDPVKDVRRPEGSHVPMLLARMSSSDKPGWEKFRSTLDRFGNASGLFRDVEIKRMGVRGSDPFQIQITSSEAGFNLVDVGYGVSQVLPLIVDSLQMPKESTFLLQQPEVHLHPKAQAELGSFLALLSKTENKRFIIETHSDNLMDRIRMEIRDKVLSPNDVSILYFGRENGGVHIHSVEVDSLGNLINPPQGYREFFLQEEKRLLWG